MQLWPTIARNVRRIGLVSAAVIAVRVIWYWPWIGIRRLLAPSPPDDATKIRERAPW